MSKEISPSRQNYRDYIHGKAKLKNAVMLQPDDKINDYIRKHTKRRFWVKEYESWKRDLNEEGGMGLAPGEGNPIAPTPSSLGSGDEFPSIGNDKKKKEVNEAYGEAIETFEYPLTQQDIAIFHEPEEFGEITNIRAKVHYRAEIEHSRYGIEDVIFIVDSIVLGWESRTFSPEDAEGEDPMDEDKDFNIEKPNVKIEKNSLPFYPSDMNIDFHKSVDPSKWTFEIQFGRDHYSY